MQNLAIYVDTVNSYTETASYERIELYGFDTVEVTSTIQNIRDIGEVFTDYSQEFTVPASQVNNKVFSHFYKESITNGYDARIKHRGYITLSGVTFRNGYFRLNGVDEVNGRPSQYRLTFFGAMSTLKDVFNDDELSSLSAQLVNYNHTYSEAIAYSGLKVGLGYSGGSMIESTLKDVVYPAISVDKLWYYDSTALSTPTDEESNLYGSGGALTTGIDWLSLKPAIKIKHIITAIEDKYSSVDFSNDFFSGSDFNELYLLLHKNKGRIQSADTQRLLELDGSDNYQYNTGSGDLRPLVTKTFDEVGFVGLTHTYDVTFYITANNTEDYTLKIKDGDGNTLTSGDYASSSEQSITVNLSSTALKTWALFLEVNSDGVTTFTTRAQIVKYEQFVNYADEKPYEDLLTLTSQYVTAPLAKTYSMTSNLFIGEQMPKMKIIDFLKGLFKVFNLTAYVDDDGVIVVKDLNTFYNDGSIQDISEYVITSSRSVDKMELFSTLNFDYVKPKTFGIINQNELQQDDYGNLEFNGEGSGLFDGSKYTVKAPFERVLYSRLTDENTGVSDRLTPFCNSWLVDKDENPTITSPILFYNINTTIDTGTWDFAFINKTNALTQFNRPSSLANSDNTSLNFEDAIDEYENATYPNATLFEKYYRDYVGNMYDISSRVIRLSAYLPLRISLSLELNDEIQINDVLYKINEMTMNLNTGKTDFELITSY